MLKLWPIMAAACLTACGDMPSVGDYTGRAVGIPQTVPQLSLTELLVGESNAHPGKIWVQATRGATARMVFHSMQSTWAASRPEIEPAYRAAALAYLARDRKDCRLSNPVPHPDYFGMEFDVACAP